MCGPRSIEDESFEDLHSKFIDLKLIVGLRHFSIPLPEWWKRIEWIGYLERLEILDSFMDDWPEFWNPFFNDPACDEKVAREAISVRNALYKKIARARADVGKSEIEEYDF